MEEIIKFQANCFSVVALYKPRSKQLENETFFFSYQSTRW